MARTAPAEHETQAPDSRPSLQPAARRLRAKVSMTRDGNIVVEVVQPRGESQPLIPSLQRHRCQIPTCHRWAYAGSLAGQRSLGLTVGAYCGTCVEDLILRCLELHNRLPRAGTEFYCRLCGSIRDVSDRTPDDRDGRQRLLCK